MDYLKSRIDLIRLGLVAFGSGQDLQVVLETEGVDFDDFVSTLARSADASKWRETMERLPMLYGGTGRGDPYAVKRVCTGSVDFEPDRRDIGDVGVEVATEYNEIPNYSMYLLRARNGRRAKRAVARGEAFPLFRTHVIDAPDENQQDALSRKRTEFREFDELCTRLVAEGASSSIGGAGIEELATRALDRFSSIQGDDFSGRRRIKLLSTQARIDGFRLIIQSFKQDQRIDDAADAEGKDLESLASYWLDVGDDGQVGEAIDGTGPMYSAGLPGDRGILKTLIYEREPVEDEFTRVTTDPVDGIPVWLREIVDPARAGLYYALGRGEDPDSAWGNLRGKRTKNLFVSGMPPYEQPEATREANDLYDSIVRDVGNVSPLWDLEERIGQTFSVWSVRRSFSPFV